MIRCKDCLYRKDNTCLRIKYNDGPCKGQPMVICSKNTIRPTELQIKTSPRWCPLKEGV